MCKTRGFSCRFRYLAAMALALDFIDAAFGAPLNDGWTADDADRANTRLIGRSAWNTRWVLIIPAGQMLGGSAENRQTALDVFIHGADTDHDGQIDVSPVTDIELGLKTYSHAGN